MATLLLEDSQKEAGWPGTALCALEATGLLPGGLWDPNLEAWKRTGVGTKCRAEAAHSMSPMGAQFLGEHAVKAVARHHTSTPLKKWS